MEIRTGGLDHPEVVALLQEHLQSMAQLSPPESIHALDIGGLREPRITFWSAWQDEELMGCGALKQLDVAHGEIKSMRTASRHRRKGVAAAMLEHILAEAGCRRYHRLSLETGSMQGFDAARQLYARFGFEFCGPFADYTDDPNSVFMTRAVPTRP
jgi:putative acetyltransferase